MQFLYPTFLWALALIAIPIIIHLFYFRRFKKVYFTNVKYLKEIKEETSNRNKLRNLLVLLSRIFALICLVLAFAQPFLTHDGRVKEGTNIVSVFVDNSYSMTTAYEDIPLLDIAKEKARDIIRAYSDSDRFQILTHAFEGRHQRLVSRDDALSYIDEIDFTPFVQSIQSIVNRQYQLLENESGNKISYIISDFQKSITQFGSIRDSLLEVNLIPVQASRFNNVSVDSVWLDGPVPLKNQVNKLLVKVSNYSNAAAEQIRIGINIEGQEKPVEIRDIAARSSITDTIPVTLTRTGWQGAVISATDYPVQFDDKYFISYFVSDSIKALSINESGPNRYLNALFDGISGFTLQNQPISQLNYQSFPVYDLIILNDLNSLSSGLATELAQYIRAGGKVLVFPGPKADLTSFNAFLINVNANTINPAVTTRKEAGSINTSEFIFSEVYIPKNTNLKLPITQYSYPLSRSQSRGEEVLIAYRDGSPFLAKYLMEYGQVFLCNAPLNADVNDLVLNAEVFVPMLYKMAVSRSRKDALAYTITNKMVIETENKRRTGDYVYVMKGKEEFIPGQQAAGSKMLLDLGSQIKEAGVYDLLLDEKPVGKYAFNYDRRESALDCYTENELAQLVAGNPQLKIISKVAQAGLTGTISDKDKGILLWKWFVIAALIFLALEIVLLRFWKS